MKILLVTLLIACTSAFKVHLRESNPCSGIMLSGLVPYENDCSYFIYCLQERGTVQRCPVMNIFDPINLRCVPGNPETCEITTTTLTPIETTTPIFSPECPEIDDYFNPVFHSHPYDCSLYFMCNNGTAILRECYEGLLWSAENEWCDYPENVICEIVTTPSPPVQPPPFCSDWIICPGSGFGFLPNFNICHRYFECIFAVRHMRTCPEGQIFDVLSLSCSQLDTAVCVVDAECID